MGDESSGDKVADYAEMFSGMLEAPTVDYEAAVDAAIRMAEENIKRFPEIATMAGEIGEILTVEGNKLLSNQFYQALENVLPGWREEVLGPQAEAVTAIGGLADEYLTGELPQDVRDQMMRDRAELGISRGLFGEAAAYGTARDLGMSSLQLQQTGAGLKSDAATLAQRLGSSAMGFMPPQADPIGLYGTNLSVLAGGSTINPSAAMDTYARIGIANAEAAWASQLSAVNMGMNLYSTDLNASIQNKQIDQAREGAWIAGISNVLGGLAGSLPW